jgi:hypothetical protein
MEFTSILSFGESTFTSFISSTSDIKPDLVIQDTTGDLINIGGFNHGKSNI